MKCQSYNLYVINSKNGENHNATIVIRNWMFITSFLYKRGSIIMSDEKWTPQDSDEKIIEDRANKYDAPKENILASLSHAVIVLKQTQKLIDNDELHNELQTDINNIYTCYNIIESIKKVNINQ